MGAVTATFLHDGAAAEGWEAMDALAPERLSDFVWIEVRDPVDDDFARLQDRFRLHGLAVRDAMDPADAAKVDAYGDDLFVVMKLAWLDQDEIRYGKVDAFLSHGRIITLRRGDDGGAAAAGALLRRRLGPQRLQPDFVLHAFLDMIVDRYFPVVEMIEAEILAIEERALAAFLDRPEVARLFRLRREALHFQHVVTRMSEACGRLTNLDYPCLGPEVRPYFRDVQDNLARLETMIRGLIDVIGAVFEASNLLEQQRQGVITRRLAAWAAILSVPTALGGIYGMNFTHMPELSTPYGYPLALSAMLAVCAALFIRFRQLRWL